MATAEQKPIVADASVVEPATIPAVDTVPAPTATAATDISPVKPVDAAEPPTTQDATKTEPEAAAQPTEEKKEEKPIEPIHSGALGYKAPGLKNLLRFSKKYFWFGEEPVPTSKLSAYLRGDKADISHPTAAWSSVTGKGLLYFAKHADQKDTPAGVLNLADATELTKDGTIAFHLKLHGSKHAFEAQDLNERNRWFVAFEQTIKHASEAKESIVSSDAYKEEMEKLGKPAALAAPAAALAPKKSTDAKPTEEDPAAAAAPVAEGTEPTRIGSSSSSSSSSDEEKKKKKAAKKNKSRSASRGKRSSIFGGLLGKKDKLEEKLEEKKEEKKEEKAEKEDTPATTGEGSAAAATPAALVGAPVITDEAPKPVEQVKSAEPAVPTEEKKTEEKPKPTKRTSIFGNIKEKLKSPTHEKKEADLVPASKDTTVSAEAPKIEELPKADETSLAPVTPSVGNATDGAADVPATAEEPKPTTPAKEKQHFSFGKFLGSTKDKSKVPSTEKASDAPVAEEPPKIEDTPAPAATVAPVEPVVPVTTAPETPAETKDEAAAENATTPVKEKKRGSLFGSFGGGSIFRKASNATKSKKEKEVSNPPAKVDEATEPKETKEGKEDTVESAPSVPLVEDKKETAVEPATLGDVVPEAVQVGQAPKSTPEVATTA